MQFNRAVRAFVLFYSGTFRAISTLSCVDNSSPRVRMLSASVCVRAELFLTVYNDMLALLTPVRQVQSIIQ